MAHVLRASYGVPNATLSKLFDGCLTSISDLISSLRLSSNTECDISSIEDDFGRLRAWASSTGASQQGPESLDYRLQHSDDMLKSVSVILVDIADSAREILRIENDPSRLPFENQTFDEEKSSSDESISELLAKEASLGIIVVPLPQSEVQQHCSNIRSAVNNLYTLSSSILNPAPENRILKSERTDRSSFESRDIERVRAKFPRGEESLVEKLGKANTKRRQIFDYLDGRDKRHGKTVDRSTPALPPLLPLPRRSARLRDTTKQTPALHMTMPVLMEIEETVGSSAPKEDEKFISEKSSAVSLPAESYPNAQFPPLPERGSNNTFVCSYCHETMKINTEEMWRKHIYEDLQAYICTHSSCRTRIQLFSDRYNWYQHELRHSSKAFLCSICKENYSVEDAFRIHFTDDHHIPPDDLEILIELCLQTRTEISIRNCILCLQEDIENYETHMGDHLQDIALFVLPRGTIEGADTERIASRYRNPLGLEPSGASKEGSATPSNFSRQKRKRGTATGSYTRSPTSPKSPRVTTSNNSQSQIYITNPEDPGFSFIFIVNELVLNQDFDNRETLAQAARRPRWDPPLFLRGFYRQNPGYVYRWSNGQISRLSDYSWRELYVESDETNEAASGIVVDANNCPLTRYRTATVIYANPFTQFRTVPGDAFARDLSKNGEAWHNPRFFHRGPAANITFVDHIGTKDYLVGNAAIAPWYKQVIPRAYICKEEKAMESPGLAGLLPLLIALMAFSCSPTELDDVLRLDRSWRNRDWVRHERKTGRQEKRGMVVTVYLDPENPQGSTRESLRRFEEADDGRPVLRPGGRYQNKPPTTPSDTE